MKLDILLKSGLTRSVQFFNSIHERFREHRLYGPVAFGLLTVSLLLPPFGGAATDAIKYACLLFSAALICFSVHTGMSGTTITWLNRWVIVFVVWAAVVTITARDPLFALIGAFPRYNSSWLVYSFFAATIWVCVYVGAGLRATIERLLLGISFCIALFGLLQSFGVGYYGGLVSALSLAPDRVPSLMGNPNFSSWFVASVLPLALYYTLQSKSFVQKILWVCYVFISMWSLAIFTSRGAIVAAVLGYAVFTACVYAVRQWRVATALLGLGLLSLLLFNGYYHIYRPQQTAGFLAIQDSSANDRYAAWYVAGTVWMEHKWLGIGPGNFDQYYWERLPTARMGGDQYFDDPHNVLLAVLVDLGMPGFVLFGLLLSVSAALALRLLYRSRELGSWAATSAGVCVWLASGLFNPAVVGLWLLLAVLLGNILSHSFALYTVVSIRSRWAPYGWKLVGLGFCALAGGLVVGEYALVYSIALESYRANPQAVRQQLRITQIAAKIEPYNLEIRSAAVFTRTRAGLSAPAVRKEIQSIFNLHPYSTRAGLIAAQLTVDLWYRDHDPVDLAQAERYLQTALERSAGYPVVDSWAAIFYWRTNQPRLAERYAHYATYKQPRYLDNWLLLAKIYRERNNLRGMEYVLSKAQELVPGNAELAKLRKQLKDAQDVRAVELRPGELSTITRLH